MTEFKKLDRVSSFFEVTSQWIQDHRWVGSGHNASILSVGQSGLIYSFDSENLDNIQIFANYTPGVDLLDDLTVYLDIPIFGSVLLAQVPTYPLSSDVATNLTINVADIITGGLTFQYVGDGDSKQVFTNYYLDVPYSSLLEDSISVFPVNFQGIQALQTTTAFDEQPPQQADGQDELLADFFDDHLYNGIFFIESLEPKGNNASAGLKQSRDESPSNLYSIDTYIASRVHLIVSIDPDLKASGRVAFKAPLVGEVGIGTIFGSLQSGIIVNIHAVVVQGVIILAVEFPDSGGVDLYVEIRLVSVLFLFYYPRTRVRHIK